MEIKHCLAPGNVLVDLRATDKVGLLEEMAQRAAAALGIDGEGLARAVLKREELGSTGMGTGVAVPHARLADLAAPFGMLARLRKPIDFAAIDAAPVDLVFLLLLPAAPGGDQLNTLAAVARKLRNPDIAARLRHADDAATMHRVMCGG